MSTPESSEVTKLLLAWKEGDPGALDKLIPPAHAELRRLARSYMRRERGGHTLQTTALINEAYLRLIDAQRVPWENRAHFYGVAAQLMRRILVDSARERNFQKRGGGVHHVAFDEALAVSASSDPDVVALDEALRELEKVDGRKARVVEMRFFGGLSEKEIAAALDVAQETVKRDWRLAKAWILRWLSEAMPG